jgi:hypothetical protein
MVGEEAHRVVEVAGLERRRLASTSMQIRCAFPPSLLMNGIRL